MIWLLPGHRRPDFALPERSADGQGLCGCSAVGTSASRSQPLQAGPALSKAVTPQLPALPVPLLQPIPDITGFEKLFIVKNPKHIPKWRTCALRLPSFKN